MKKKVQAKDKAFIKDAEDIILNDIEDETALKHLSEIWIDDFPELDLGTMDLHEAIETIGENKKKSKAIKTIEDLNKSLGEFIEMQEKKAKKAEKAKAGKKTKSTKKAKSTKKTKKSKSTKKSKK